MGYGKVILMVAQWQVVVSVCGVCVEDIVGSFCWGEKERFELCGVVAVEVDLSCICL